MIIVENRHQFAEKIYRSTTKNRYNDKAMPKLVVLSTIAANPSLTIIGAKA